MANRNTPATPNRVANGFFFLLVILVTAAFFGLIKDFMIGVFWAVVLSILFGEWYRRILSKVKDRKNLASGLTIVSVLLLVIIPVTFIGIAAVNEALSMGQQVSSGEFSFEETLLAIENWIPTWVKNYGVDIEQIREKATEWLGNSSQLIAGKALGFTQGIFGLMLQFTITLYVLFFFLRDGRKLVDQLIYVLPMGDEKEVMLIERFESVARATVKGSILIALIQGILGGILFMMLGVPGAVLWGALMIIAALLPVGSVLVWGPIAAILLFDGKYTEAIVLIVVGALFIGLIDNLLRPRLVGNDTKMPDYLILLSTLGGLTWFGLTGFVLGPIIAALFITCWQIMGDDYGEKQLGKGSLFARSNKQQDSDLDP